MDVGKALPLRRCTLHFGFSQLRSLASKKSTQQNQYSFCEDKDLL
jgi:hypothetical protein